MTGSIWVWKHNSKIHFLAVRQWYSHYRVAAGMGLLNQKLFTSYIKIHSLPSDSTFLNFLSCSAFPWSQLKTTALSAPSQCCNSFIFWFQLHKLRWSSFLLPVFALLPSQRYHIATWCFTKPSKLQTAFTAWQQFWELSCFWCETTLTEILPSKGNNP